MVRRPFAQTHRFMSRLSYERTTDGWTRSRWCSTTHEALPTGSGGQGFVTCGVSDGTRTRDSQDHNLVLYQLNYAHHRRRKPR